MEQMDWTGNLLGREWYLGKTEEVARGLLGKQLVRNLPDGWSRVAMWRRRADAEGLSVEEQAKILGIGGDEWRQMRDGCAGGVRLVCRIRETEAYLGVEDLACHTARGPRDGRSRSMWKTGGHAYVYFTYGMHFCLNVVTGGEDRGEAVLIRAVDEPEDCVGRVVVRAGRLLAGKRVTPATGWLRGGLLGGPAKLCQGLAIGRLQDGVDMTVWPGDGLVVVDAGARAGKVSAGPRVGIDRVPEPWRSAALRFWEE